MKGRLRHRRDRAPHSSWVSPQRRLRPCLGVCDVTWHAVDSYLNRVPGVARRGAHAALSAIAERAELCGRTPTGEDVYEVDGMHLIVWRPARRRPVVVTIIVPEDAR